MNTPQERIDICFPVSGCRIPVDHGYLLYSALSRIVPEIHGHPEFGLLPIQGRKNDDREMRLNPGSKLTLRTSPHLLDCLLTLAGKPISFHKAEFHLGFPCLHTLMPHSSLQSEIVTIKPRAPRVTQKNFSEALLRQLKLLGVSGNTLVQVGQQRTVRIKRREIIGFEVSLQNLSPHDSLVIQSCGLGGRRSIGCGQFTPYQHHRSSQSTLESDTQSLQAVETVP